MEKIEISELIDGEIKTKENLKQKEDFSFEDLSKEQAKEILTLENEYNSIKSLYDSLYEKNESLSADIRDLELRKRQLELEVGALSRGVEMIYSFWQNY